MIFRQKKKKPDSSYFVTIGAGKNQLPIIKAALELDLNVIGVDQDPMAEGLALSQIRLIESIHEYRKIYHKLHSMPMLTDKIAGVGSRSYGKAGRTVSYLSKKLQLTGNPFVHYNRFLDKWLMHEQLKQNGLRVVPSFALSGRRTLPSNKKLPLPWILKKRVSHAKQGTFYVPIRNKAAEIIRTQGHKKDWLLESYQEHEMELSILGLVYLGKLYIAEIFEKITTGPPFFVELKHRMPPPLSAKQRKKIHQQSQKAATAMKIENGPIVIEALVKDEGITFLEVVPEFGGEYLAEALFHRNPPIDLFRTTIKILTKKENPVKDLKGFATPSRNALIVQYLTLAEDNGRLQSIEIPKTIEDNVVHQELFVAEGDRIKAPQNNLERLGFFLMVGTEREEVTRQADSYAAQFQFHL